MAVATRGIAPAIGSLPDFDVVFVLVANTRRSQVTSSHLVGDQGAQKPTRMLRPPNSSDVENLQTVEPAPVRGLECAGSRVTNLDRKLTQFVI